MVRFHEVVSAAVDLFNKGSLRQAALLLESAERWQADHRLDSASVMLVRDRIGLALDGERILRAAGRIEERPSLRTVLGFFSSYAVDHLLESLRLEPRRDRRRWLLAVLEAHGERVRSAAVARLRPPLGGDFGESEWYLRRNLLHLLRRIARASETSVGEDVDIGSRHARLGLPSLVVKEAIGLLGQIRDERAELALVRLLGELADMVPFRDSFGETRNLTSVADRAASALASFPTPTARHAILNYAERVHLESGRPMSALAVLGRLDLSTDEATVDRLIGLIRRSRPSGFAERLRAMRSDEDQRDMVPMIEALSGTPLPVVRRTLEQIVAHHPTEIAGKAASRALARLPKREP